MDWIAGVEGKFSFALQQLFNSPEVETAARVDSLAPLPSFDFVHNL